MSIYIDLDSDFLRAMQETNKFSFDKALKLFSKGRRYLIKEKWTERPTAGTKPEKIQVCFADEGNLQSVSDLCSLWQIVEKESKAKPVLPDVCFGRIGQARKTGTPLNIFVPWGVRPDPKQPTYDPCGFMEGSAENSALDAVSAFQSLLSGYNIQSTAIIMPADVYAIEINNLNAPLVQNYFGALANELTRRKISCSCRIDPWSAIRARETKQYTQLLSSYTTEAIRAALPQGMIDNAIKSAQNFNPDKDDKAQKDAAFQYLRERLCEANLIEETLRPIKFSLVDPAKDSRVDGPLPRLYLLPDQLRFPWLKPLPAQVL